MLWGSKTSCFRESKLFSWQEQNWHPPLSLNWMVSRVLPCTSGESLAVSGRVMSEWDFVSSSCLCSLILGLLGGNFSCIDYLSVAEELYKPSPHLCVFQRTIIQHSEKSITWTIRPREDKELFLGARDGCLSKLNQEEECRRLLMGGRNIYVHSGGEDLVME